MEDNIPILDGSEYSIQEAIDNIRYKVYYYNLNRVLVKEFDSFSEALKFSVKLPTGDVMEIKRIY